MSGRRGSVAVEFALVAPLLLTLAGGIVELGGALRAYAAVNRLAMQYAISFADCSDTSSGVCQTELNQYVTSFMTGNIAPMLTPANLVVSMSQVLMNGTTPTVEYQSTGSPALSAAQTTALQAAVPSGQTGVVDTVTYQYSLLVFATLMTPIIGSSFNISYTVAQLK